MDKGRRRNTETGKKETKRRKRTRRICKKDCRKTNNLNGTRRMANRKEKVLKEDEFQKKKHVEIYSKYSTNAI